MAITFIVFTFSSDTVSGLGKKKNGLSQNKPLWLIVKDREIRESDCACKIDLEPFFCFSCASKVEVANSEFCDTVYMGPEEGNVYFSCLFCVTLLPSDLKSSTRKY